MRAAALAVLAACSAQDIVASGAGGEGAAFCLGTGPVVLVGDGITVADGDGTTEEVCAGTVAVRTFTRALCTCEGYATSTALTVDSFDSAAGPYVPGGPAGATGGAGVNGALQASAPIEIAGPLAVAGTGGAALLADLRVARELALGGPLGTGVRVTVGGDARIAGDVHLGTLEVAGTLTVPSDAVVDAVVTAGATVRAPVAVAPPCACGDDELVDIAGFVAAHAADHQDAQIGLAPDRLTDYRGDVSLDLPCGIYYVGPIRGDGALALRITGRVALLVDGDLTLTAPFTVELATDDAELDLMIAGLPSSTHRLAIGRADHPSRTRVYAGGTGTINLSGDSVVAANLYAPRAALAVSAPATVFGSIFARRLDQAAPVAIHYDTDVRRADVGCPIL